MNSVVHFEITADEPQRAKKFYGDVFDWKFQETGKEFGNYIMAMTAPTDENGMNKTPATINGGIMKKDATAKQTIITVAVTNLDETLAKVKNNGGKVISEKVEIPGVGHYCRIEDTEGNVVSLMQPTQEWKEKAKK